MFPATRMRRLRKTGLLRGLVRETELSPAHLIYPMFVRHGIDGRVPIASMPGIDHLSISAAVEEAGVAAHRDDVRVGRAEAVERLVAARHRDGPPPGSETVGHHGPPDVAGAEDDEDGWPAHAGSLTTRAAVPPAVDSAG